MRVPGGPDMWCCHRAAGRHGGRTRCLAEVGNGQAPELCGQQPGGRFTTRREAQPAVFDYLETIANPRRRHSVLGNIAPATFEARHTLTTAA